jgi:hypothetical protein
VMRTCMYCDALDVIGCDVWDVLDVMYWMRTCMY